MTARFNITQKGLVLVALPLVAQLCFLWLLGTTLVQAQTDLDKVAKAREVIAKADDLTGVLFRLTRSAALFEMTGDRKHKDAFRNAGREAMDQYKDIKALLEDGSKQSQNLRSLEDSTLRVVAQLDGLKIDKRNLNLKSLARKGADIGLQADSVRLGRALKELVDQQKSIKKHGPAEREAFRQRLLWILAGGLSLNVSLTVALAVFYRRSITNRLVRVSENASRLSSESGALQPAISGYDEIADLDVVLHSAAQQLCELELSKKRMVALIGKRLQDPLRRIHEIGEHLLTSSDLEQNSQSRLHSAQQSTERLMRLIQDLNSIQNSQDISVAINEAVVSIDAVVRLSIASVGELALAKEITVVAPQAIPHTVLADEDRLVQVLVNVLSNAIRYSPSATTVTITVESRDPFIELRVSDEGPGIPPADRERVFELYVQVDSADSAIKGGTGLGLPISRQIVRQLGGEILIESPSGCGCVFSVLLPTASASATPAAKESEVCS